MSNDIKREVNYAHKQEIRKLTDRNKEEVTSLKVSHDKRKNQIINSQMREIIQLENQNHKELLERNTKQEKVLEKLQDSLDKTKEQIEKEKIEITQNQEIFKNQKKAEKDAILAQREEQSNIILTEMSKRAEDQMRQLQTEIDDKQAQLRSEGAVKLNKQRSEGQDKVGLTKSEYERKINETRFKYNNELDRQKRLHVATKTKIERDHLGRIGTLNREYDRITKRVENDGQLKQMTKQNVHEQRYKDLTQKHTKEIQGLEGRRVEILRSLRNAIMEKHKIDQSQKGDPFYVHTELNPSVSAEESVYKVSLPIPPEIETATNVNIEKRTITISTNRHYENLEELPLGGENRVHKTESVSKKIQVEDILDPNSVKKEFKDGILTFIIKKA